MLNKIEISKLRVFKEVYSSLNLHRASEQLHITPSAVSQSLKNLESDLGIQLFVRSKKSVLPTWEAHQLFERVIPSLQSLLHELTHFMTGDGLKVRSIRIGAQESFGKVLILPKIKEWEKKFSVSIELILSNSQDLLVKLKSGQIDLFFATDDFYALGVEIGLNRREQMSDALILASHSKFNLPKNINLESLCEIPHILGSEVEAADFYFECFKKRPQFLNVKILSSNSQVRLNSVLKKLGVGIFHQIEIQDYLDNKTLYDISKKFHLSPRKINYFFMPNMQFSDSLNSIIADIIA